MIKWLKKVSRYVNITVQRYQKREKEVKLYRERYKYNWGVITITLLVFVCSAAIFFLLGNLSSGTYLAGWFAFSAVAVLVLIAISAPYCIVVTNKNILLHGYVDIYQIRLSEVEAMSIIHKKCYKHYIPVIASLGYFGYFGYFFNWKKMEFCKVYATKYSNWVEVKTTGNNTYIINVSNPVDFIYQYDEIINSLKQQK